MYSRPLAFTLLAVLAALLLAQPARGQGHRVVEKVDELNIAFPAYDGTLTPYTFRRGYALMTLVYDTLTWRDAEGTPRPWLARSVRRENGGRRVVVTLRQGAEWHDGEPVTARDVAFTYDYMRRHEHPRFTPQLRDIRSVRVSGARTVVFELRRPNLGFDDQPLSDVPILPRHIWSQLPAGRDYPTGLPIGSGPYRLVDRTVGRDIPVQGYRFEANRGYFLGTPYAEQIFVRIASTQSDAFDLLDRGRLDLAPAVRSLRAPLRPSGDVNFTEAPSFTGTMLQFNLLRAPFDSIDARRAVAESLPIDEVAGRQRGAGARVAADRGFLHPTSRWARVKFDPWYDRERAEVAFSEQGVGPFRVLVSSQDILRVEAARRIVAALRRAGAQVRLVTVSSAALERELGRGRSEPTFEAAVVGIPALVSYDPSYLRAVFGSRGAPLNDGGYSSARFDALSNDIARARTAADRRRAVSRQQELLVAELPALPLFFGGTSFAFREDVYGGWVDVLGVSFLDKQSFVPNESGTVAERPEPLPLTADAAPEEPDTGFSLLPIIIGLVVVVIGLIAWRLTRRNA